MAKKTPEPYCKNCRLFDPIEKECQVVILHEGQKHHLKVEAGDRCFFETEFAAVNPEGETEKFKVDVEQVKVWVENPDTGEKSDKGIVKIEYPESLAPDPHGNDQD